MTDHLAGTPVRYVQPDKRLMRDILKSLKRLKLADDVAIATLIAIGAGGYAEIVRSARPEWTAAQREEAVVTAISLMVRGHIRLPANAPRPADFIWGKPQ